MTALAPQPGETVIDCTTGWAGHSVELLKAVGPSGRLFALDLDGENLPKARERLMEVGNPFSLHQANFASLQAVLANENISAVDAVLADLGMSSMQVDDPDRGFSYVRDGPLDMRMDRSRGRQVADLLATLREKDLAEALQSFGDEPNADEIASAIVAAREKSPLLRTSDLARLLVEAAGGEPWRLHPQPGKWNLHPAARTFQALRILVNRELANLQNLLRILPMVLRPGGRAAIISFHSGEDRLVKNSFRDGRRADIYASVSPDPVRAGFDERETNPRARSAKLRWAKT
jgi:16S rRNA (cytosine1402-N4)-methyltransferase